MDRSRCREMTHQCSVINPHYTLNSTLGTIQSSQTGTKVSPKKKLDSLGPGSPQSRQVNVVGTGTTFNPPTQTPGFTPDSDQGAAPQTKYKRNRSHGPCSIPQQVHLPLQLRSWFWVDIHSANSRHALFPVPCGRSCLCNCGLRHLS